MDDEVIVLFPLQKVPNNLILTTFSISDDLFTYKYSRKTEISVHARKRITEVRKWEFQVVSSFLGLRLKKS